MPATINIADIIEIGDRFLVIQVTPGPERNRSDEVFATGTDAEGYLHGEGFAYDPSTNTYSR